jgi:hypothetical protein
VGGLVLLLLLALGMGGKGSGNGNGGGSNGGGNGNGWVGPAGPGSVPSGDPPGGCRLVYSSPAATVQALNMLGYTPLPQIWGPDEQLGTFDATPDPEVRQFQQDYNQASRSNYLASAGGVSADGLMGKCTMAAIEYAAAQAPAWRERYMHRATVGFAEG